MNIRWNPGPYTDKDNPRNMCISLVFKVSNSAGVVSSYYLCSVMSILYVEETTCLPLYCFIAYCSNTAQQVSSCGRPLMRLYSLTIFFIFSSRILLKCICFFYFCSLDHAFSFGKQRTNKMYREHQCISTLIYSYTFQRFSCAIFREFSMNLLNCCPMSWKRNRMRAVYYNRLRDWATIQQAHIKLPEDGAWEAPKPVGVN
jgi:hypothetical protein